MQRREGAKQVGPGADPARQSGIAHAMHVHAFHPLLAEKVQVVACQNVHFDTVLGELAREVQGMGLDAADGGRKNAG